MSKTKAEKAAIILANEKINRANKFYGYHKEVIDEYNRLAEEAMTAKHDVLMIRVKQIERGDFDNQK